MGFHILAYLLCTFTGIIVASSPRHARDQVLSVKLQSDKEIRFIKQIFNQYEAVLWHPSSVDNIKINKEIHLYFNASNVEEVKTQLTASTIAFRVLIEDVQQLITKQKLTNVPFTPRGFSSYYEMYHPLEEIYLWMSQITKAYPSLIQKILIGSSAEKRLIYVLKVFNGTVSPKGALWIDCGIHAREWIAPAFCQWFLQYDRFWRKNLSKHNGGHCVGTDLNRNWDANWCGSGASSDPCSETYCGRYPESEPEVKAVAAFIRKRSDHIMSYISIHSYSQMVMFPYSYKLSRSKDHDELNYVAWKAVTAVRSVHGTSYSYGNSAKTIYLSSGCSDDWAYDLGIKYSFTFELRDTGTYGFLLPPSFIKPTCEEATAAVSEILHHIVQRI
ncbi:carboxypeptidase B2 isoform X2 [Stegostoma tigrinum]|uniref:carboxypeptidase B2 isoform X2 n=1 Tax=Stegostoma tigrinum TaxID=3053191 RepID=UPI00202B0C44|nr:carboxypeptidase B2 isoform X2 [Stegostoma tigrinum]